MQVYIHTFIATREAHNLSPLQPTEPIHVRLFFSEHHITTDDYRQYMEWAGAPEQLTEFHALGAAPASLTKASLVPPNSFATQVGTVKYDFMLEAQEDYLAYLEFVRQTLKVEAQRPVFRPFLKPTDVIQEPEVDAGLAYELGFTGTVVTSTKDIQHNSELPTFVLVHPPNPEKCHKVYSLWFYILKEYAEKGHFYRKEDATAREPQLQSFETSYCWRICTKLQDVVESVKRWGSVLYQLTTGHLVAEKSYRYFWGDVLGTEAMPLVKVQTELSLQGPFLRKRSGEAIMETRLTEAQLSIVKQFFTNKDIRPFSIGALYDLFTKPNVAKPLTTPTIRAGAFLGKNTLGSMNPRIELQDVNGVFPANTVNPCSSETTSTTNKNQNDPSGLDTHACGWEAVKTVPEKTPASGDVRQQLLTMIHAFKNGYTSYPTIPESMYSSIPVQDLQKLYQYGFLLYLIDQKYDQKSIEISTSDYQRMIDSYKQSNMDLQGVEFTHVHIMILYALLTKDTAFLEYILPTAESLEMRLVFSLCKYAMEYRNPEHYTVVYQTMIKEFAKELTKDEDGRVGAKALWDVFLLFLRKQKMDYVGFLGTQQEFNDVMRDLGWEQKRIAAGKVWLKMKLPAVYDDTKY